MLVDENKIKCLLSDLVKVPLSSELIECLKVHKEDMKEILKKLNDNTNFEGCDLQQKQAAMSQCTSEMKPILDAIKEGNRRVKSAGLKPTKGLESESAVESK